MKNAFLVSALLLLISGCSVSQQSVENHPPVIRKDLAQFGSAYGAFKISQVSIFLWPLGMSEDQTQDLVARINGASLKADPYMIDSAILGKKADTLQLAWDKLADGKSCFEKYADIDPNDPMAPSKDDPVMTWKSDGVTDQAELKFCQDNQAAREEITKLQDEDRRAALPFLSEILTAIDPDQAHPVNSRALDKTGTSIEINADGSVRISLGGFLIPGNNPSTTNGQIMKAAYLPSLKVLTFVVPEVSSKEQPTGLFYAFALERGPDHGPLARFVGDMNLVDADGKIVRYGSARIDAIAP